MKPSKKQHIVKELKELLSIIIYLAASFSFLSTVKSVVLIQIGIHNFEHGYIVALVEALALSKIVLLAQNLRILKFMDKNPLVWSAFIKSAILSVIVFAGSEVEEAIFARHVAEAPLKHQLTIMGAHILGLVCVFYVLFIARGLDVALGSGKLRKLLLSPVEVPPPPPEEVQQPINQST